jgi:hypothetical protein
MRAVVHGDEKRKLLVPHAPADVGEAFLEIHGDQECSLDRRLDLSWPDLFRPSR